MAAALFGGSVAFDVPGEDGEFGASDVRPTAKRGRRNSVTMGDNIARVLSGLSGN